MLDYYFPIRPALDTAFGTLVSPFVYVYSVASESDSLLHFFKAFFHRKPLKLRPEDFIQAKRKEPGFLPAATTTSTFQLHHDALHSLVLRNNGTTGVERNTQSFFLNPAYQQSIVVKPFETLELKRAISFEPHALTAQETKHQMLLFVKTNQTSLQTISLSGQTGSGIIDLLRVEKVVHGVERQKMPFA